MAKTSRSPQPQLTGGPAGPASCLALLQTCRQIYLETSLLFYTLNTLHLSNPQEMLSFLRHLGTERCGEIRSLHLRDMLAPQESLDYFRSLPNYTAHDIARLASERQDQTHPNAEMALQLLNKRGKLQKLYLDMRPSQTLVYIDLCTQIPGFKNREIVFASPTRWSVMVSSRWETRSWFSKFLEDTLENSPRNMGYYAYWGGDEKYRVEVDILPVLPEGRTDPSLDDDRTMEGGIGEDSSVDTAMESLNLS